MEFLIRGKSNGIDLGVGDIAEATIIGGGGYGAPLRREPERVAANLALSAISSEAARDIYGVMVDADGQVDALATKAHRAELLAARRSWTPTTVSSEAIVAVARGE